MLTTWEGYTNTADDARAVAGLLQLEVNNE